MKINKVAFIGKGAIGLLYAHIIERNLGHGVAEFVMDDERFARHNPSSVTINGAPCSIVTRAERDASPVDLVILTVKATGLEGALTTMERLVRPGTRIMSLLNGVTSEQRIAQRFGWENTVMSVTQGMDAVFLDGALTFTHRGEIRFGAAPATDPEAVSDIAEFLECAGIPYTIENDVRHRLWVKLMLNAGINQTCMVYEGSYGSASEPGTEQNRCYIAAMREALAVARAEGIDVTEADLSQMVALISSLDPDGIPSMVQDRINKKPTEVEEFAGTIIRLAERHDILVPQNRYLYDRIREIEASFIDAGNCQQMP